MALLTLILFILTYLGLAIGSFAGLRLDRTGIAFVGAVAMLACGAITLPRAIQSINFPSVLILFALMVIASQLRFAGFYRRVAELIGSSLKNPALLLAAVMLCGALLSSVLSNSVVGVAFTPALIMGLRHRGLNPAPFLIALILACNIGSALTVFGNAQNVIIAGIAGIRFADYLKFSLLPVGLTLAGAYLVVWTLGHRHFTQSAEAGMLVNDEAPFHRWRTIKGLGMMTLVVILFFTDMPHYLVALTAAALLLCSRHLESRHVLGGVDLQILLLFISLFVVTGAFQEQGWTGQLSQQLHRWHLELNDPLTLAIVTGVLSNFISNAAAVMLLSGMVDFHAAAELAPVMALANTFAGNFLLTGSVSALLVAQTAEFSGVRVGFREFAYYGIPTAGCAFFLLIGRIIFF